MIIITTNFIKLRELDAITVAAVRKGIGNLSWSKICVQEQHLRRRVILYGTIITHPTKVTKQQSYLFLQTYIT